jgi:hypothetical protein
MAVHMCASPLIFGPLAICSAASTMSLAVAFATNDIRLLHRLFPRKRVISTSPFEWLTRFGLDWLRQ